MGAAVITASREEVNFSPLTLVPIQKLTQHLHLNLRGLCPDGNFTGKACSGSLRKQTVRSHGVCANSVRSRERERQEVETIPTVVGVQGECFSP